MYAFGQAQFVDKLRMLTAEALKIVGAPDRQATGQIALRNLVAHDEFAVHLNGLRHLWNSLRRERCGLWRHGNHGPVLGGWRRNERRGTHLKSAVPSVCLKSIVPP